MEEEDFESDGESTASTDAHGGAPITSTTGVWKRMAANIATAQLDDASLCMMASCFSRYLENHSVPA